MKVFFIYNPFTKHPRSVDETYFEHMWCAGKFFVKLQLLSFAALVHSVFPFWFENTASKGIKKLNDCMKDRRPERTEFDTYFPPNDFDLPTHEEIEKAKKRGKI
jgi:hypothetical protein